MVGRRGANRDQPPIRKSLGQHFLSDARILSRIVEAVDLRAGDTVIEIGPGRGSMTDLLRATGARVIAVEYDRMLAARLRERYAADQHVTIVESDVLRTNLASLASGPYAVVGNVPYYITTPILFHAMREPRPSRAVFLVQREVAERMGAVSGSKAYGALSVNLQALARVEVLFRVAAGAFRPPPKVESAVVRLTPRTDSVVAADEEADFSDFVQAVFGMRRKQVRRVVREMEPMTIDRAESVLRGAGIDPDVRPETLRIEQFVALFRALRD